MSAAEEVVLQVADVFNLAAEDGIFFSHCFFPRTVRQGSAQMHHDLWVGLEEKDSRYFAAEIFRGGAKTTNTRLFTAKRISYGISRTILYVSKSLGHAVRSIRWLKRQIETNRKWTAFYGLSRGSKWTDDEISIKHAGMGIEITVIAAGITGQIRGINTQDDFRPDLIVVDDPNDEENAATEEQRTKMDALFFGSLQNSLTPPTENPFSKMVLLATSLDSHDLINQAHASSNWKTIKFPCFLMDETKGEVSAWPQRFTTEFLKAERQAYIDRGQFYLWLREMECKLASPDGAAFNSKLLQFYENPPEVMDVLFAIDPARSNQKSAHKCAIVAIGLANSKAYLLEYYAQKGKNPEEIWNQFFLMAQRWRPRQVAIESVAYQQVLAWYFGTKMNQENYFVSILEFNDRRSKPNRIRQAIGGRLANGSLLIRKTHIDVIKQITDYRDGVDFDLLDALAIALDSATPWLLNSIDGEAEDLSYLMDEKLIPPLKLMEGSLCP